MKKILFLLCLGMVLPVFGSAQTDPAEQRISSAQLAAEQSEVKVPVVDPSYKKGAALYQKNCSSCHNRNVLGAPGFGHERYRADIEILIANAINGIGNMPARGHTAFLSDDDIRAIVEYMVEMSK